MTSSSRKTIAVASGKGGTGKTMIATNLAALLDGCRLIDCDVEEPNSHIFLNPQIQSQIPVYAEVPGVDASRCNGCGACAEACRFQAIACAAGRIIMFPELCHSCSVCYTVCPRDALKPAQHELGQLRSGTFEGGKPFIDGLLKIGQVRSAEVISRLVAAGSSAPVTLRDCPPGTSCSMVASVRGADAAVLVTEPTPFGLHDLKAAVETLEWLGIPHCVIINKCDLGTNATQEYCENLGIPIVGRIPFTREIARSVSSGKLLVDESENWRELFAGIARRILSGELRTAHRDMPEPGAETEEVHDLFSRCRDRRQTADVRSVVILSGKGGTGKTTLTASFAALLKDKVAADCDVDAANLHLLLDGEVTSTGYFRSSYVAEIDPDKCRGCGACAQACRFDAISMTPRAEVDPLLCEGCGLCEIICPLAKHGAENPVTIRERIDGEIYRSKTTGGDFVHAMLYPGGEASGKLVTLVRATAETLAAEAGLREIMIDASPGIGCPVNASITQAELAVVVTEPSLSAAHDLKRVIELTRFFGIETMAVINRADLNPEAIAQLEDICGRAGIPIVGRIPFDRHIVDAMAHGLPPVKYQPCKSKDAIVSIFNQVYKQSKGAEHATR